jgi:serine/threonine protein kinase
MDLIFDSGSIKIADFGLSKSLPVNKHAGYDLDSKFKLTGETGSYRYMAPEVFRHEPYNNKVHISNHTFPRAAVCLTLCF